MHDEHDLAAWISSDLVVAPSRIDRNGVFTRTDQPLGTVVIRFGGSLFSREARFDWESLERGSVVGISETVLLAEPAGMGRDLSDYLNHSCSPNLALLDALTLVAARDIPAGQELTVDYAYWEEDESYLMKRACSCQSPGCRKTITGADWRLPQLRARLLTSASPFIRRRVRRHFGP